MNAQYYTNKPSWNEVLATKNQEKENQDVLGKAASALYNRIAARPLESWNALNALGFAPNVSFKWDNEDISIVYKAYVLLPLTILDRAGI